MPPEINNSENSATTQNPSDLNFNQGMGQQQSGGNQKGQPKQQSSGINEESIMTMMQQYGEQIKFEMQKAFSQALNAKAQQLSDINPMVATALGAAAGALNEAIMDVIPVGENDEFNSQPQAQQQQAQQQNIPQKKQASDYDVNEVIWNAVIEKVNSIGYFEKNASQDESKVEEDLMETVGIIGIGIDKFAQENQIDFTDPSNEDLLIENINNNTFFQSGIEELNNEE